MAYNRRMPTPPETNDPCNVRVAFLGSGSSGNAAVITDGTTTVLVDCGFSAREVVRRMRLYGIAPETVSAALITHEHSDHVRGVEVFARRFGCSVWATEGTRRAARLDAHVQDVRTLTPGEPQSIGTLDVLAFRTSHDAAEPVGYVVGDRGSGDCVGLASDTGTFTDEQAEALSGCGTLGLECNHDPEMLQTGPYPWFLKQRIASSRGHLANADAAQALDRTATDRLSHVYALHLSRTNNTHELARVALEARLAELGLAVGVTAVSQDLPAPAHSIAFAGQLRFGAEAAS